MAVVHNAAMQNGWIEKDGEEVESQVPSCGMGVNIRWQYLVFFSFMYIVQLYKED